jgi:hypothetical protein
MATQKHPLTGVELNPIPIERPALTFDEAVTAHVLRLQGDKFTLIAQRLGTNPFRVGEVMRGDKHPGSADAALKIISAQPGLARRPMLRAD